MLASLRVSVSFCETEVHRVDIVLPFPYPNQKIVWFNISVEIQPRVNVFDSLDHLVSQHQHCFQRELPAALPEQLFQTGSQHIHYHAVALLMGAEPINAGNADSVG